MTTKTRTNNSDINESTGNHSESLVRCMADWIKEAHEAIENGDYAGGLRVFVLHTALNSKS